MAKQTDPVCGMQIGEEDAAGQAEYEGKTYYFCSTACQQKFEANPAEYADQ
ncbi:MAG TPA: YHS domain-containing protein [Pyrinomonadaceae bacterium]|jgi:Cu+-exporting ATPase